MRRFMVSASLLALILSGCGGGGGGDSPSTPSSPPVTPPPVTISPPVVVATASSPTSGPAPLTVGFDASKSTDPQSLALSYSWDWGDGTTPHGTGATPTHTYSAPGSYGATVIVSNGTTQTISSPIVITVNTPAPTASFTYTIDGLTVNVDASGTANPGGKPLTYTWDWSDGTPKGDGVKTSHTYTGGSPRPYIRLTVSDGTNSSDYGITVPVLTPTVGGYWQGSNTDSLGHVVNWAALVSEDGILYARTVDTITNCVTVYSGGVLTPATQLNFTGGIKGILLAPCTYPDGSTVVQGKISGTVVATKTISFTSDVFTTSGTEFTGNYTGTFSDKYLEPRLLSDLTGQFTDSGNGWVFTVKPDPTSSSDEAITASDPISGCQFNGRAFLYDIYHNLFSLDGNLTQCSDAYKYLNGTTGSGIMIFDTQVTPSQAIGGIEAFFTDPKGVPMEYIAVFDYPKTQ